MRTQGSVDGRIVYAGYKGFDPQNPANNIVDDTPNDLTDNAPVPLAKFSSARARLPVPQLRHDRRSAHRRHHRPLRHQQRLQPARCASSATGPDNQEIRGSYTGTLSQEGRADHRYVGIGANGFGPVTVTVVDPNTQNAPVLERRSHAAAQLRAVRFRRPPSERHDHFDQVPVGGYSVDAFSKALGSRSSAQPSRRSHHRRVGPDLLQFSGKVNGTSTDPEARQPRSAGHAGHADRDQLPAREPAPTSIGAFVFDGVREGTFVLDAKDT